MKKTTAILCLVFSISTIFASHKNNLITALELAHLLPNQTSHATFIINQNPSFQDKVKGIWCLGAYGDAQARITEFITNIEVLKEKRPDSSKQHNYPEIPPISTLKTDKPYARFTDDTHMSIYLAEALLKSADKPIESILDNIVTNFILWNHSDQTERAPGIAATNNSTQLEQLKNQGSQGMQLWSRGKLDSLDNSKNDQGLRKPLFNNEGGSGAVMRVAPVSIMFKDNPDFAEKLAVAQGILTHTDSGSRAACAGFNAALIAMLHNQSLQTMWEHVFFVTEKYDNRAYSQSYDPKKYFYGNTHFSANGCATMCRAAHNYFEMGLTQKPYQEVLDEFRGWGATEALAAALYIFSTWNNDPYTAMTIAINRTPGDSDTIAIMVGELFGAQYGYDNIANNFTQHGIHFDDEIKNLETIQDLKEYQKTDWFSQPGTDFPTFQNMNIKTFNDLAVAMSSIKKTDPSKATNPQQISKKTSSHTPEFILTIGDIMTLDVDCIVNPANEQIQGGGGMDGIITQNQKPNGSGQYHPAVGDTSHKILDELKTVKETVLSNNQGLLPVAEAVITNSGTIVNQGAKTIRYVISTVGPRGPADQTKNRQLFNAYHNCLVLAADITKYNLFSNSPKTLPTYLTNIIQQLKSAPIRTIAFPSISTGIFNYPATDAAPAAISGIIQAMQQFPDSFDTVRLVIHPSNVGQPPYAAYAMEIQKSTYKTMLNDATKPSPVAISIQKMDGSKQVIYQP